tara:strand:- start:121 stop:327 length:207 start_codon:yes stop_codon:yes gene_type:complete
MDKERKGEIAYAILLNQARRNGVILGKNRRRELGNIAKATGIPIAELEEFGRDALQELSVETFGEGSN